MPIFGQTVPFDGVNVESVTGQIASLMGQGAATADHGKEMAAQNASDVDPVLYAGMSDAFFRWNVLDTTGYNSVYHYQLVITNKGRYVNHISFPIAPQSISVGNPVASNLGVTMKGIVEDNNAAPLRPITVAGVAGVWHSDVPDPTKNNVVQNSLEYAFRNTIQAVDRVKTNLARVASAFSGQAQKFEGPLNYVTLEDGDEQLKKSGWYFFQNLERFLSFYIAKKKTRDGKDYRLTWQMHKDVMYFDVILNDFSWDKKQGTLDYDYIIRMTAYRRRANPVLQDSGNALVAPTSASTLSTLASVIQGIRSTRKLIASASDVLRGIRSDADQTFFNPLREVILAGSDLVGLVTTVADFPTAIKNSAKFAIEGALQDVSGSAANLRRTLDQTVKEFGLRGDDAVPGTSSMTSKLAVQATDGQSQGASRPETAFPYERVYQDPDKYVAFFDEVVPDQLDLPDPVRDQIQAELDRVRDFNVQDYITRRELVRSFGVSVSQALGGGSAGYNEIYGLPPPEPTFKQLSVDDVILLSQINDVSSAMDKIIVAIQEAQATPQNDYFKFYQDFATTSGLQFQDSASKFYIPFPLGATLDQVALQYLGDVTRWQEIAAINGLREPYVDEQGFDVLITTNSSASSITVADPYNLDQGAIIRLSSTTKPAVQRKIRSIEFVAPSMYLIGLEGGSCLGFLVEDGAKITAYQPNTVNSQRLLAIPSASPVNLPGKVKVTPGREDLSSLSLLSGSDFLLTSDGHLVLDNSGDMRFVTGMANLVQAATLRLQTPLDQLLWLPGYGNPLQVGSSVAEVNVAQFLKNLGRQFQQDPRFTGLLAGTVKLAGPAADVKLLLGVSGTNFNLPVSAQLPL